MSRKLMIFKFYEAAFQSNNFLTQQKVERNVLPSREPDLALQEIIPRRPLTVRIIALDVPQ